jgi:hypothetical protein
VQYSLFVLRGNQIGLESVLRGIAELIESEADDVRAYHLPDRCEVAMLGTQSLPDGVMLAAQGLDRLLRELTLGEEGIIVGEVIEASEQTLQS